MAQPPHGAGPQQERRYFFDLIWRGRVRRDATGLRLKPGSDVRRAAIHAAAEHAVDMGAGDADTVQVAVRDEGGTAVLTVRLEYN